MTFVRKVIDRKVRDLVEREYDHRPVTVPLRDEPDEVDGVAFEANDPGGLVDLDTVIDAAAYLKLKLRRPGGAEWLAYHGYGYSLTATERQRLKRFQDTLTDAERGTMAAMLAAWMFAA
jgi:hypothetical protein